MKMYSGFALILSAMLALQSNAQTMSATETQTMASRAESFTREGSREMLTFFSNGDVTSYDKAISNWRQAKVLYENILKNGTAAKYASTFAMVYQSELSMLETELSVMGGRRIRDKVLAEKPKDRKKKIKAGGTVYKVSKDVYSYAKMAALDLK